MIFQEAELEHSAFQAYQSLQVSDTASVHSIHTLSSLSSTSSSSSSSSPATSVLAPVELPITVTSGSPGLTITLPSKPPSTTQQQQHHQHIPTALPNIATLSSSAPPLQTLSSPVTGTQATQLPAVVALPVPKTLSAPAIVSTISPELSTSITRLTQDITSPSTCKLHLKIFLRNSLCKQCQIMCKPYQKHLSKYYQNYSSKHYQNHLKEGCPHGVMVQTLDCGIEKSLSSSHANTFTFSQIPLGKV